MQLDLVFTFCPCSENLVSLTPSACALVDTGEVHVNKRHQTFLIPSSRNAIGPKQSEGIRKKQLFSEVPNYSQPSILVASHLLIETHVDKKKMHALGEQHTVLE